jgi:WD40 repeat protein
VTAAADGTVRVWPVRNPEFVQIPLDRSAVPALAFSPDNTRLAISEFTAGAAPQGNTTRVRVVPVPPHAGDPFELRPRIALGIVALAFFPDSRRLAGADRDGVHLLDPDNAAASRFIAEFGVWDVSVGPDGRYLATATRNPGVNPRPDVVTEFHLAMAGAKLTAPPRQPVPAIKIWRVADGQLERTLPGQISVSFSPDGRRLAGARDRSVVVWDAATGEELRTLAGPADPVLKVQFAAGGRQVVGFTHRQATVWDADNGRTIATVDGLNGPAFVTPDGRRIVGFNSGIKWWDVQLGREVLFLPMPEGRLRQLALSADGRRIAASGDDKLVLWEAGPP